MSDDLLARIAQVSITSRCCADCAPTDVDYALAAEIIRDLGLRQEWAGRLGVTDHWHVVGDTWIEGNP